MVKKYEKEVEVKVEKKEVKKYADGELGVLGKSNHIGLKSKSQVIKE